MFRILHQHTDCFRSAGFGKVVNFKITGIFTGVMLMIGCSTPDRERMILGTWQVDSVYTFYNGFGFTRYGVGEEPMLEFKTNGIGAFFLRGEQRPFSYAIRLPDTLKLMNEDRSQVLHEYKIQQLTPTAIVLRLEKRTLFKEKNQDRYEIRYLSKTTN
jgi:hypothetical protein